ncbi:antimicrobial response protein [Lithospermum erythrorhizon]|uniref:Antimicrobial response protein n=1 Tax=Lithospermum erythrorhizon TaxID=34254 RepID=A0AAV3RCA1_LITER
MNLDSLVSKVGYQLTAVVRKQVTDHLTLVTGVEKEIQNISTNLRKIQQVVHDAETRQTKDSNIKEWLEKLEDFSYEIEDVVDEWNTEIRRYQVEADEFVEKVWCCFLSYVLCFNLVKTRHDIGVKIKKLNEKLELIVKEKDKYNFLPSVKVDSKEWKPMESTSFSDNISTSAQDEAKKKLIHKLCTITKNPIPIIKIVGAGGIGKTTLSQLAFNDKKVEVQFDKKIWICVGESFDGLKIANGILKSLNKDSKDEFKDESHVEIALKKIHKTILKKKVLLVLDDVWMVNEVDWEKLKRCTSDVAFGSKIVVTTRSDDVAKTLGATDEVSVKLLTNDDCWRVIKNIALWGTSEDICKKFEPVGKQIAEKCKGLPLAAKALGSLLRFRGTKKEWEEVQKSKLWQLAGVVDDIFPLLQLSYTDLPSAMKRCFVFCAILPKDDEIDVDDLIRMWIAQGYIITENRGDKMEQIGIRYFRGLVSRGFFQEVSKESNGILTCKMHDIVHDFAQYLGKEECVTLGEAKEADSCKDVRHLAITCKDIGVGALISFLLSVYQTGKTRSIFIRSMGINERMLRLLCHLKHLRILRIHDKGLKKLPKEVGNLSHLRLLDVKRTELEELPDKICDLHNLQVLYCCVYIRKLPLNIWRLMNLRTLHVGSSIMEIPQSIERLTNLQHLPVYGVGKNSNKLSYLRNLNQLRGHMLIRFREEMSRQTDVEEAKMAEFEKKKIDSLVLSLFGSNASKEVIEALKPHPNLSELVLSGLSISDFFGLDETADKNCTCYPNLKTLEFSCWGDLVKWDDIDVLKEIHLSAIIMPCLEKLQVNYADRLEVLPYNLLSKATKLHSIEFNEIKYGPITSLSSNKPPFVRLPKRTTSASPFTNNCGDELFFRCHPVVELQTKLKGRGKNIKYI